MHSHAFWCSCGCLSPLSPQLCRGLAMLRYFDPAFMDAVANSMCEQLRSFDDVQIGNVLFAFATFGYSGPPDFLPTVAKEVGRLDPCAGMCPPFTLFGRQCAPSCSPFNSPTLVKSWKLEITVAKSQKHFSRLTQQFSHPLGLTIQTGHAFRHPVCASKTGSAGPSRHDEVRVLRDNLNACLVIVL